MDHLPLIIDAVSTACVLALAAQTWWKFKKSSVNEHQKLYEDEDGAATEDSQKEYLSIVRILKYAVIALWSVGCLLSLSAAVLATTATSTGLSLDWFAFASWVSRLISPEDIFSKLIDLPTRFSYLPRSQSFTWNANLSSCLNRHLEPLLPSYYSLHL